MKHFSKLILLSVPIIKALYFLCISDAIKNINCLVHPNRRPKLCKKYKYNYSYRIKNYSVITLVTKKRCKLSVYVYFCRYEKKKPKCCLFIYVCISQIMIDYSKLNLWNVFMANNIFSLYFRCNKKNIKTLVNHNLHLKVYEKGNEIYNNWDTNHH